MLSPFRMCVVTSFYQRPASRVYFFMLFSICTIYYTLSASQEPSEILNHTYEYTMREDIVMCMEELELEPEKARALLRSPCPLNDVYKEFRDRETEHMDTIRDSIETEADKSLQRQEKKQQRESR